MTLLQLVDELGRRAESAQRWEEIKREYPALAGYLYPRLVKPEDRDA